MRVVLDASGMLALLNSEPGAGVVAKMLPQAIMSSVNLSEVVSKMADNGVPEPVVHELLDGFDLEVVPFDIEQSYRAGMLSPSTRSQGLSLGARACIALAMGLGLPVLTGDRIWADLDLGIEVQLTR